MLPRGYTIRAATLADAEAVHALVSACNVKVIGISDGTVEQVRRDLAEPGFDLATDSWLVHAADGVLAGFAWAFGKRADGRVELVDVDVFGTDDAVRDDLFGRVIARAAEMAGGPHTVGIGVFRDDAPTRAAAEAHGFAPATTFHRMRIDHDGDAALVEPPPGVTLCGGRDVHRAGHAILVEAFKDHFGVVTKPYDEWQATVDLDPSFRVTVAELAGRPVGILMTNDSYVEEDDCGHVADLGVLADARGRGIAGFLLRTAFAADRGAGRRGTILHVDTNNTTPALGLYERAGMRPVLVIDIWQCEVR